MSALPRSASGASLPTRNRRAGTSRSKSNDGDFTWQPDGDSGESLSQDEQDYQNLAQPDPEPWRAEGLDASPCAKPMKGIGGYYRALIAVGVAMQKDKTLDAYLTGNVLEEISSVGGDQR